MTAPAEPSASTTLHFLVVKVGPATYAIPAGPIRQLLSVTESPPRFGPAIPTVDLRSLLYPSLPRPSVPSIVVVEWPTARFIRLAVDKFYEVISLSPSAIHSLANPTPPIHATTRRKGRSCYLLDLDELLASLNTPDRCGAV